MGDKRTETIRFGQGGRPTVEAEDEDIPPFPNPKLQMVRILWQRPGKGSSFGEGTEWTMLSGAIYREPILVDTVGILLQKTDTAYLVTQSIDRNGENKGRQVIGKDMVKEIHYLEPAAVPAT